MNDSNYTCPSCKSEAKMYVTKAGYYIRCTCGLSTPVEHTQGRAKSMWFELFKTFKPNNTEEPKQELHRGDVFWCEVPPRTTNEGAITYVHYGRKPYIILSNEVQCAHSEVVTAVPITTSEYKKATPYHPYVQCKDKTPMVLGEQITALPRDYILNKMCTLSEEDLRKTEEAVLYATGITAPIDKKYKEAYNTLKELCAKYKEDKDYE
jgi:mRNA-degrading endonuclease toxin of MazEF toxin-antitoxin module